MAMPNCYSTFLYESLLKQQKILPSYRSLKEVDICGATSVARIFVAWYRHIFCGYKLKYLSRWCLDVWSFTNEGLGIYPIWTKYILFLLTLDGSASILRPKESINFLHSVLFTVKTVSLFSPFQCNKVISE